MQRPMAPTIILWAPRVLALMFALFLSIFALDVFNEGYTPWETLVALAMHLIPSGIILVSLAIAWRWELAGAVVFVSLGALYLALSWGRFDLATYALIAGPPILIGTLFMVDWVWRSRHAT